VSRLPFNVVFAAEVWPTSIRVWTSWATPTLVAHRADSAVLEKKPPLRAA